MPNIKEVSITCSDGYKLAGALFIPEAAKAAVMIGPATGIRQQFYRAFATFLSAHDYAVVTFDNRGIGHSKGATFEEGNPSLVSWGKLDMTAVLELLGHTFPRIDYHLIGHSAGGQLAGLMGNAKDLRSMFNFGCSSGSVSNMAYPYKLVAHFWLNFVIPTSNLVFGHTKSQWFGMGEPLPKQVAYEWQKYCNSKGYIAAELGTNIHEHWYNQLTFPTQWLHATDDNIATLVNVKDMIRVYEKIEYEIISLNPKDFGFQEIGHMSFFSSKKQQLWAYALRWLQQFD